MDLSRSEYPALLECLQPGQAVTVAEDRIRLIGKVNSDIADWLSDRRRVEEAYVQGLKKLASRRPQEASFEFGVFNTPWQSIVSSTESLAQSHATLSQRIEVDVERPLREYASQNREMQTMITIQGNLVTVGKELESAQRKVEKIKGGKSSANKVANATSDVENASQQWESQAPYVFERLQAVDENRVNHLRDALTQLKTHEIDLIDKTRTAAEGCLNAILSVETSDEISSFVARASAGQPALARQKSRSRTATNSMLTPPAPVRPQDDGASEVSGVSAGARRSGLSPAPEQRRSAFGGLKRLGTVMGRRRQNSKPLEMPSSPEKRTRNNLNPLRRGRTMQSIPSPEASVVNLPSFPPRRESIPQEPRVSQPLENSRSPPEQRRLTDEVNGDVILPAPARSSSLPATNGIQSNQDQVKAQQTQPKTPPEKPIERDVDGFTIPPPANDEISRVQQEAGQMESEPQFKLDIRNEPIREEDGEAQSALSNVANTLRAQAQQGATPRKPTANRGRRDVRNTVFVPSPHPPEITGLGDLPMPSGSPFGPARSTPLSPDAGYNNADAQSIRSSLSMSSMTNPIIKHPEMHHLPGLNASIVETVSAWYSQSQVTRAVVIGELALAHNRGETTSTSSFENIRLENFPVLEKVAPNPSFITQLPSRSGEYSVALSQIPRTTVAFKYQVHLEESNLSAHAPIVLTPTWKVEPKQVSVILNYSFNPAFVSPMKRTVTLKNVTVFINIETRKALSCQSKPAGIFHKEKSTIYWKLGDVALDGYADAPQKLLARFATESEARPGTVEVRWEISGDDATGIGSGLGLSQMTPGSWGAGNDPFSDESAAGSPAGGWKEVAVARKVVSGKYVASELI